MMVEHKFVLEAVCPVGGASDRYDVTVRTHRLVKVEDIVAEAERLAREPRFQEDITAQLASRFEVEVETVGPHMEGRVTTRCVACG